MTTFPNPVQASSVSTIINPVPVIAEMEVNNAPIGDMKPGAVLETGRDNSKAPMSATTKKLYTSIIGDVGPRTETSRRPTWVRTGDISDCLGRRTTLSPGLGPDGFCNFKV